MAPKTKSVAQGGSSSKKKKGTLPHPSRQPTPVELFLDSNAAELFNRSYHTKKVISGRRVVFRDFSEFHLDAFFAEIGWARFVSLNEVVYPRLVRLFYANLFFEDGAINSFVLGRHISLTRAEFAAILEIPDGGIEDVYYRSLMDFAYPEGHSVGLACTALHGENNAAFYVNSEVKYFTRVSQILARIVSEDIVPKAGEFTNARGSTPLIIYCIIARIRINLPKLMFDHMACPELSRRALPYGMVLTKIFMAFGIPIPQSEPTSPPSMALDRSFLSRSAGHIHVQVPESDEEEEEEQQQEQEIPAVPAAAGAAAPASPTTVDIMRRLEEMSIRQEQIYQTQYEMAAAQRHEHQRLSQYFRFAGYQEPTYEFTQFSHPLPPTGPPFQPYPEPPQDGDDDDDQDRD